MENGHAKYRVAVIGSGNWGSVASRLIASNTAKLPSFYGSWHSNSHSSAFSASNNIDKIAYIPVLSLCWVVFCDMHEPYAPCYLQDEVRMWVFEEILPTGKKLSESINKENENCKYLPGIKLGGNVIADPDLESAVKDANMLVFVTPHQFVEGICKKLVGKLKPGAEAISLIKGMEIAVEKFSEATIGYRKDKEVATRWAKLFTTPYFLVSVAEDIEGVELCGTLKNIVAIAAGFICHHIL
ncbi:hypothetical protein BAE44_0026112, partial [Dichanthelium oligosanthes]